MVLLQIVYLFFKLLLYKKNKSNQSLITFCRLLETNLYIKFVTNTTKESKRILQERLSKLGFPIQKNDIVSSLAAARNLIEAGKLKPMLILAPEALEDFENVVCPEGQSPNAVVIGLAPTEFYYDRLNEAFR